MELLRNKEGLLHVSELSDDPPSQHPEGTHGVVHQHLHIGQKLQVLCTAVDPVQGTIRLSLKQLLLRQQQQQQQTNQDDNTLAVAAASAQD